MKTFLKVLGGLGLVLAALIIGAVAFLSLKKPAAHPP